MDEFNAMVYMFRSKNTLDGMINFEDSAVFNGVYATYELDKNDDIARNDIGFIITPELKRNPLTIKLVNPFFLNARYVLSCTVRSLVGANIFDEDNNDYNTVDNFTVELVEGVPVGLDLSSYTNDSILDFSMAVSISFDVPEIVTREFRLELSSNATEIKYGERITLTASLINEDNIQGYFVEFFEDNVSISKGVTDENGMCVLSYAPLAGNHIYTVKCLGLTDTINVTTNMLTTKMNISLSESTINYGETLIIDGILLIDNKPVENLNVNLYDNNNLITVLTTDNNGNVSYSSDNWSGGNHNFSLVYDGTANHTGSNASASIIVKLDVILQIYSHSTYIRAGETYNITGILTDENNNLLPNRTLELRYNGRTYGTDSVTTDENGKFKINQSLTTWTKFIDILDKGDNYYNAKSIRQYTEVRPYTTAFTDIIIHSTYIEGYLCTLENNQPIKNKEISVVYYPTEWDYEYSGGWESSGKTDSNGYFKIVMGKNGGVQIKPFVWEYLEYDPLKGKNMDYYNSECRQDITEIPIIHETEILNQGATYAGGLFTYKGKLIDDEGNPVSGVDILRTADTGGTSSYITTNSNGEFSFRHAIETGFTCVFKGNEFYEGCEGRVY